MDNPTTERPEQPQQPEIKVYDNFLPDNAPLERGTLRPSPWDNLFMVSVELQNTSPATAGFYGAFFIAPIVCEVIEAWESHRTAASGGTLTLEKLTSAQAKGSGVNMLTTTWDLTSTADTPVRVKATLTQPNRILSPNQRMGLLTGSLSGSPVDLVVTVLLRPLSFNVLSS